MGSGQGLSIYAFNGAYPAWSFGEWYYTIPNNGTPTTSYIPAASFALGQRRTNTGGYGATANAGKVQTFQALWSPSTSWLGVQAQDYNATWIYGSTASTTSTAATHAVIALQATSSASRSEWAWAYLEHAAVYLDDTDSPELNSVTHSAPLSGWVNHNVTDTVTGTATDGGLGVRAWALWGGPAGMIPKYRSCTGITQSPCSHTSNSANSEGANSFTYTTTQEGVTAYVLGATTP